MRKDTKAVDLEDVRAWLEDATQGDDASDRAGVVMRDYIRLAVAHSAEVGREACGPYTWIEDTHEFCTLCAFIIGFDNFAELGEI